LANDYFNVFVVDTNTLQSVHVLNLIDDVLSQGLNTF